MKQKTRSKLVYIAIIIWCLILGFFVGLAIHHLMNLLSSSIFR